MGAWLTFIVTIASIVAMVSGLLAPAAAMLGAVIILLITGVLTPEQALAGFSNPAPVTVAALFILARAAEKTRALHSVTSVLMGDKKSRWSLARLLVPSAAVSAFLNNTPLVAMMVPQVVDWCRRRTVSPSRYLMPLSHAVVLGGVLTSMGTSTNIVVSGLLARSGEAALGLFEIGRLGLPVCCAGLVVLLFCARFLPERRLPHRDLEENVREFVVHMTVATGGPLDGVTVESGRLRHLQGVFLVQLEHHDQVVAPVTPQTLLRGGDRLTFVGRADLVVDLHSTPGLVSSEQNQVRHFDTTQHTFIEVVLGRYSSLVGRTLKESDFRNVYQAAVVAIHRQGQRVRAKLGEVRLRPGDTLLVLSDRGFVERWRHRNEFLLVSELGGTPPAATKKAWLVLATVALVVVVAGLQMLPMLQVSLLAVVALVGARVLTAAEVRNAIDFDVLLAIGASFALGTAIELTGLADVSAAAGALLFHNLGYRGALLFVLVTTVILTELITNNAAAILMYPIVLTLAHRIGVDPRGLIVAMTVMASTSFLTPIGYQTNMMVYGPGGYRFSDYLRLGTPLTIVCILVCLLMVPVLWPIS